jgi:hypothetical protein
MVVSQVYIVCISSLKAKEDPEIAGNPNRSETFEVTFQRM